MGVGLIDGIRKRTRRRIVTRFMIANAFVALGVGSKSVWEERGPLGVDEVDEASNSDESKDGHGDNDDDELGSETGLTPERTVDEKPSVGTFATSVLVWVCMTYTAFAIGTRRSAPKNKLCSTVITNRENGYNVGNGLCRRRRQGRKLDLCYSGALSRID